MNAASDSLKKLQVQFLTSAARWANYGTEVEGSTVDLPIIVSMLQSVGYNLRRIDSVSPDDVSPLSNGQKGTRVIVTCGYSGQRCFLELPEQQEQCKCLIKADKSQDSFWEVTATNASSKNASIIETGSDSVPAMSKDASTLLRNMLMLLSHIVQGTLDEAEESLSKSTSSLHNNTSRGATSSPKKDAKRISGFMKEFVNPPIIISSPTPKGKDSPARYRSLDTLNKDPDEIIPPPGLLTPKSKRTIGTNITQSSPNINLFEKNEATNSSGSTIAESNNEKVVQLLQKAISMLRANRSQDVSPSPLNKPVTIKEENITPSKYASSPNLSIKNKPKTRKLIKGFTIDDKGEKPGKPISGKLPLRTSSLIKVAVKPKSPQEPVSKLTTPDQNKNLCTKPRKINNLYSHVKSTIPKASPPGNFISKKC